MSFPQEMIICIWSCDHLSAADWHGEKMGEKYYEIDMIVDWSIGYTSRKLEEKKTNRFEPNELVRLSYLADWLYAFWHTGSHKLKMAAAKPEVLPISAYSWNIIEIWTAIPLFSITGNSTISIWTCNRKSDIQLFWV